MTLPKAVFFSLLTKPTSSLFISAYLENAYARGDGHVYVVSRPGNRSVRAENPGCTCGRGLRRAIRQTGLGAEQDVGHFLFPQASHLAKPVWAQSAGTGHSPWASWVNRIYKEHLPFHTPLLGRAGQGRPFEKAKESVLHQVWTNSVCDC